MKKITLTIFLFFLIWIMLACLKEGHKKEDNISWQNKKSFACDELAAEKIAEAVWLVVYGDEILDQKPFKVELKSDSIWVVQGTYPEIQIGGTAYIEILKSNCRVLEVSHGE